jgi:hypothetical protein
MTAPDTRYAVRIHEKILYDVPKSGIASINIISAYMTILATRLNIDTDTPSAFQA